MEGNIARSMCARRSASDTRASLRSKRNLPRQYLQRAEWLQHLAHPAAIKLFGSDVGATEVAYRILMKFCRARANYELLHYRFNFAGRVARSKHPPPSSAVRSRALHWNGTASAKRPCVHDGGRSSWSQKSKWTMPTLTTIGSTSPWQMYALLTPLYRTDWLRLP